MRAFGADQPFPDQLISQKLPKRIRNMLEMIDH
jgi:hypothetical protein